MSNYYYIVAGLPDITATDAKPALTPEQVSEEILEHVSAGDRRVLELYLLRHDNANLLQLLKADGGMLADGRWEPGGLYSRDQLQAGIDAVKADGADAEWGVLPAYMKTFLVDCLKDGGADVLAATLGDDKADVLSHVYKDSRLSSLYYDEAIRHTDGDVRRWFEFSLNLGNLLTAASCRRLDMSPKTYVIGDNDVAEQLRTSTARDWNLTGELDYMDQVLAIAAETDALKKERDLDQLRWQWIEDAVVFHAFGVERLLAYLIQLDIISRWAGIDAARGEEKLRTIVEAFKQRVVK